MKAELSSSSYTSRTFHARGTVYVRVSCRRSYASTRWSASLARWCACSARATAATARRWRARSRSCAAAEGASWMIVVALAAWSSGACCSGPEIVEGYFAAECVQALGEGARGRLVADQRGFGDLWVRTTTDRRGDRAERSNRQDSLRTHLQEAWRPRSGVGDRRGATPRTHPLAVGRGTLRQCSANGCGRVPSPG